MAEEEQSCDYWHRFLFYCSREARWRESATVTTDPQATPRELYGARRLREALGRSGAKTSGAVLVGVKSSRLFAGIRRAAGFCNTGGVVSSWPGGQPLGRRRQRPFRGAVRLPGAGSARRGIAGAAPQPQRDGRPGLPHPRHLPVLDETGYSLTGPSLARTSLGSTTAN